MTNRFLSVPPAGTPPLLIFFLFILLIPAGCSRSGEVDPGSERYRQAVSDFYISLAAAQTDEAFFAFEKMNQVAEAFPEEAAAWANLGLFAMRQGAFEQAEEHFTRALRLAPDHPDLLHLAGLLQSRWGRTGPAIDYFRRAAESDPDNRMILYSLATELEREDDTAHAEEIREQLLRLHRLDPENQPVLYELARITAKEEDLSGFRRWLETLTTFSGSWSPEAQEQLSLLEEAAGRGDFNEIRLELSFLRNMLEPVPSFQAGVEDLRPPPGEVGYPVTRFLILPQPEFIAAEADTGIAFDPADLLADVEGPVALLQSVTLLEELPPIPVALHDSRLYIDAGTQLPFPLGSTDSSGRAGGPEPIPSSALTEIDYNNDFLNDLAMAWEGGFHLWRQNPDRTFTDVTSDTGVPASIRNRPWSGVWAADLDQDGDLDLLLASAGRDVQVLRNNGDGTFTPITPFPDTPSVVEFHWADLDGEGATDALFLTDEGELLHYRNLRGLRFERIASFPGIRGIRTVAVADLDGDGEYEVLAVHEDLSIVRYLPRPPGEPWPEERLVKTPGQRTTAPGESGSESGRAPDEYRRGSVSLFVQDLDNNGAFDLLLSTPEWSMLHPGSSRFRFDHAAISLPGGIRSVFDLDGDERLDLIGMDPDGNPFGLMNRGNPDYRGLSLRARASGTEGDGRINSFGIGGEMEIRAGLLYRKQPIGSPIVHFGIGLQEEADLVRIIWPNGSTQTGFAELGVGSTIQNEQILKGSCPWLFTNDGEQIHFITDALWRAPLGLRINALETAGVVQTLDRVRIPGEKLAPVNGVYDLRITAELWETHFFDHTSLIAVDHPEGTEVFVDERFAFPSPDLSTRIMGTPRPVSRVTDTAGRDVTRYVEKRDGDFLAPFRKTQWQGLVEEHFIEIEIGSEAPEDAPLWLLAYGWLRPTDSSINLALSQGSHDPPSGLRIEVADGRGGWKRLHDQYGVPAGKLKTILLDLEGVFPDPSDRRIRFYTTSEIYWDSIEWAKKLPDASFVERPLRPVRQELRYRGFSRWYRPDERSPMLPDYSTLSGTTPRWLDLRGFHTRFGEVDELLAGIDDRYVIMNAGDELHLEYEAPAPPEEGWKRTFIFISDGWVKDGDINTQASATVEPLPWHGQADYDYPSGTSLFEDPVFQRFRDDWVYYHTRYVSPRPFRNTLLFDRKSQGLAEETAEPGSAKLLSVGRGSGETDPEVLNRDPADRSLERLARVD